MKDFIIISPVNAVTYKEIFPKIKEGIYNVSCKGSHIIQFTNGDKIVAWWLTTLNNPNKNKLVLTQKYSPDKYPKYDNYDAINVDRVKDIPYDNNEVMGVPITILKYDLDKFKIIGIACGNSWANYPDILKQLNYNPNIKYGRGDGTPILNGKATYARILIRKHN